MIEACPSNCQTLLEHNFFTVHLIFFCFWRLTKHKLCIFSKCELYQFKTIEDYWRNAYMRRVASNWRPHANWHRPAWQLLAQCPSVNTPTQADRILNLGPPQIWGGWHAPWGRIFPSSVNHVCLENFTEPASSVLSRAKRGTSANLKYCWAFQGRLDSRLPKKDVCRLWRER